MNRYKKPSAEKKNTLQLALFFGIALFFLVFLSLCFKVFAIWTKSTFDARHTFTLLVSPVTSPESASQKKEIITFSPDRNALSVLILEGEVDAASVPDILAIPIDGTIVAKDTNEGIVLQDDGKNVYAQMRALFFRMHQFQGSLTSVDIARLMLFAYGVPSQNIVSQRLSLPAEEAYIDKIITNAMTDASLLQEKISIQIVNGTEISGLGSKVARMVTNMGGNVVSVTNADTVRKTSEVQYRGEETYTVRRLGQVFGIPVKTIENPAISDIIIIIGEDKEDLKFKK